MSIGVSTCLCNTVTVFTKPYILIVIVAILPRSADSVALLTANKPHYYQSFHSLDMFEGGQLVLHLPVFSASS